jgi:phosphonate transport system permease protein
MYKPPELLAPDVTGRPDLPMRPRVARWVITALIIIPFLWSALGLEVSLERLLRAPSDIWNIVHRLVPPDLSPVTVQRAMPKIMESLFIAWVGTMIAAVISLPLALLAARNVSSKVTNGFVRQIFIAIRALPEIVIAIALIPVTGLGPWTGTLAIGLNSIGTLGKLSSEAIEAIDPGPVEAVHAVGGTKVAAMRFGILPQVMPTIVAYWLYRFEINIRASAVLGIVGAGGIGLEMVEQIRFRNFGRVGTVLFLTIIVVLTIDMISAKLRRRIISGQREPGPIAAFQKGGALQRVATIGFALVAAYFVVFLLVQLQAPT